MAAIALMGVGLVVFLPNLLSRPYFHRALVSRATGKIRGQAHMEEVKLRWWGPSQIRTLRIAASDDLPTLEVASLDGEKSLWQHLWSGTNLGKFRIDRPRLYYSLDADGVSNFARTFTLKDAASASTNTDVTDSTRSMASQLTAACQIVDGEFHFQGSPQDDPFVLGPLSVTVQLEREPTSASSDAVIQGGRLLERTQLTSQICNKLMKYAAPVLADVSWAEGQFTLDIREAKFPLHDPTSGILDGTLTIHAVRVGPNAFISQLLQELGLRRSLTLVEESPVQFQMANGRVYHEGLRFLAGDVTVDTSGYVGLDESLELTATISLPELPAEGPIRRVLDSRTVTLPIRGTLSRPEIEQGFFQEQGASLVADLLPEIPGLVEELQQLGQEARQAVRNRRASRADGAAQVDEDSALGGRLLRGLIRRSLSREEDVPSRDESHPDEDAESSPEYNEGVPRRPLREIRRRRRSR